MPQKDTLILSPKVVHNGDGEPLSPQMVEAILRTALDDAALIEPLIAFFTKPDAPVANIAQFFANVRKFFADNLPAMLNSGAPGVTAANLVAQADKWMQFETAFEENARRYQMRPDGSREGIFWPDPTHPKHPQSLYDMRPFVERYGILDKNTPIASAGSCFAYEVASYLQRHEFNYLVVEPEPAAERTSEYSGSSARWGIIFNTPSFRQLAEKAAGMIELPKLAELREDLGENIWQDPFRENVYFSSLRALEANRAPHIAACREVFEKTEVFIVTLGLNECWAYRPDGAVVSRNPKSLAHYMLFEHRTLSVDDNVEDLNRMLVALRSINKNIKIVVSVSPIPFMATGLGHHKHVITANTHSKAVLRAAADAFVSANDGVYYLPSYEMVQHCIKDPWEPDQRHVRREAVAQIMEMFEDIFVAQA